MARVWTEDEILDLMEKKFGDLPISKAREKAECYVIDKGDWLPDENPEEIKKLIKSVNKGAKSDKPKTERKPREKDQEKMWLIETISKCLNIYDLENANYHIENVQILNEVKEISFTVGENDYSLSLIKHRTKKN